MRNSKKNNDKIAIILPNRVGDSILTLPLLVCLNNLISSYGPEGRTYRAYSAIPLGPVFEAVGEAGLMPMGWGAKIRSWVNPPDKAFFLIATTKNFAFSATEKYGIYQPNKPFVRYSHDLPSLIGNGPSPELRSYLLDRCQLNDYSINMFGVIEALGYSVQQVIESFSFSRDSLPVDRSSFNWQIPVQEPYVVCCMEAAYGSKIRNADRRWNSDHFLSIARRITDDYQCKVVFIGLDREPPLPQVDSFIDLRITLNLWQLFQLMSRASGYLGNDTGPLHLANLAGIPSVGIYARDDIRYPLFNDLNTVLVRPKDPENVYAATRLMLDSSRDLMSSLLTI